MTQKDDRHFTKEDLQMANEMLDIISYEGNANQNPVRYHFTPTV